MTIDGEVFKVNQTTTFDLDRIFHLPPGFFRIGLAAPTDCKYGGYTILSECLI